MSKAESPVYDALQTLNEFEQSEYGSYKLIARTRESIHTLARDGLSSSDHGLFLLSAETLTRLASAATKKDDQYSEAAFAVVDQLGILSSYIQKEENDSEGRQRQEASIKLINALFRNDNEGTNEAARITMEVIHPSIVKNMLTGKNGFDEAEVLFIREHPHYKKDFINFVKSVSADIPSDIFRPVIKAFITDEKPFIQKIGLKLAEIGLDKFGFPKKEIHEQTGKIECDPEYTADNIDTIFALEHEVKGISRWLMHNQGITHFGRYPTELLLDQLKFVDDTESRWGVIIFPYSDANGAFQENIILLKRLREDVEKISSDGNPVRLRIVESKSLFSVSKILIRLSRQYGPVSFGIVGGHGSKKSLVFGTDVPGGELRKKDVKENENLQELIRQIALPNARIVLESCLTGKKHGLAQSLSALGLDVAAPSKSIGLKSLEIKARKDQILLEPVFTKNNPKNEFYNGKLVKKK